ncbi:MAG: nucleotidyltransferase family protein [Lachnospiraceae bacterium]|nr:nucleotidyltransferase family protein [Lachnospiraceae bacterium]
MKPEERKIPFIIGCLMLASGQGRRFGGNKLLAPLESRSGTKPLIEYSLLTLKSFSEAPELNNAGVKCEPFVLTCHEEVRRLCEKLSVPVRFFGGGLKSDTIRFGLSLKESAEWEGCMFIASDQPALTAQTLVRLVFSFASDPSRPVRLSYDGRAGNPVLFPRSFFSALSMLKGEQGGGALLKGEEARTGLVEAASETELMDVDTGEELILIEKLL